MGNMGHNTAFIVTFISVFIIMVISCTGQEGRHQPPSGEAENKKADTTVESVKAPGGKTPLNKTVYNNDKDLWGWNSGDYISLKWDRKGHSMFRVYKRTGYGSAWEPAWTGIINRNEFFDRDIKGYGEIEYKVEAVDNEGQVLHSYKPLSFETRQ